MRLFIASAMLLLASSAVLADTGDIIDEFTLPGQPGWGVYGLAKDWEDGNIWAVGMDTYEFCELGKFHNDNHDMLKDWEYLDLWDPPIWVMDIAYPYEVSGENYIVIADSERPELRLYNPSDCSYVGDIPADPFSSGFNTGLAANPYTCSLYSINYNFKEVRKWDGADWSKFAEYSNSPNYGVAYGWNHIFVGISDPKNKVFMIMVFEEDGTFVEEYVLNGWTHCLAGICCAREDAVGKNESLYVTFPAYAKIREVEVGNFNEGYSKLAADTDNIPAGTGGAANFSLVSGGNNANRSYIILGSMTGTDPGITLPTGLTIPLNWDVFSVLVLNALNTPVFSNFLGTLDYCGEGTAQFNTLRPVPPQYVGVKLYFAYALNDPWDLASNPVEIEIVP